MLGIDGLWPGIGSIISLGMRAFLRPCSLENVAGARGFRGWQSDGLQLPETVRASEWV